MSHVLLLIHRWCSTISARATISATDDRGSLAGTARRGVDAPLPGHGSTPVPASHPADRGQATTEYALVMLGAAVVALLVVSWATAGGGAGKVGQLFDRVIDAVAGRI